MREALPAPAFIIKMVNTINPTAIKAFQEATGDKTPLGNVPNVMPIIDISPNKNRIINIGNVGTASTSGVPVNCSFSSYNGKVYITNLTVSIIKDVTCDVTTGVLTVYSTIKGSACYLCSISLLTLTAQEHLINITLTKPMLLDYKTNIFSSTSTYTAGTFIRTITASGFLVNDD